MHCDVFLSIACIILFRLFLLFASEIAFCLDLKLFPEFHHFVSQFFPNSDLHFSSIFDHFLSAFRSVSFNLVREQTFPVSLITRGMSTCSLFSFFLQ